MATAEMGVPDKMTVFQKCVGSFNRTNVSADEARKLLTQLCHLFYVGESFQEAEATQLFFTITRLFQKDSPGLKQLIYLAIKELAPLTDNVIMGTSVLMRDVQQAQSSPQAYLYRAEALRALCCILDAGAVEGMDRLMRSAIVDRDESMSSAGLVSSYHLLAIARDSVRRWATEIQESCLSQRGVAQYHALGLLVEVRGHDVMSLLKLAVSLAEQNALSCPNAMALHVRLVGSLLVEQPKNAALWQILKGYCFNRSDIVALEAAKTTLNLPAPSNEDVVSAAIGVLRAYLESPRATSRFAAIRALSRHAETAPHAIAACNEQMEALVADSNQTIATYAITTLLRTGSEANMDSLIERVSTIVSDKTTSDDFRLVVVDAVRSLAKRFPAKHDLMLDFFANLLQHPGNVDLKLATVEAISDVLHTDSNAKSLNHALNMLGETIEDSEYPELIVRVLYLLGQIGPQAEQPSQCVRVIYNRVILENSTVRAAAVSALAKFADVVPGARALVRRSQLDKNDEVRDRASIALVSSVSALPSQKLAMADLETRLVQYLSTNDFTRQFDAAPVKLVSDEERFQRRITEEQEAVIGEPLAEPAAPARDFAAELAGVRDLSALGALLHTGADQKLTDDDMEYVVRARVHVFAEHLVLQYEIQNNYELTLSDVSVEHQIEPELEEDGVQPELSISCASLAPTERASTYLVFKHSGRPTYGFVSSTLQFTVADEGTEDSYPLDDLEIRPAEFVRPAPLATAEHAAQWAAIADELKATHQFKTSATLGDALEHLQTRIGMANCSGFTPLDADTTASLQLSGTSVFTNELVLVRCELVKSSRAGVAGRLSVRSGDEDLARVVVDGA